MKIDQINQIGLSTSGAVRNRGDGSLFYPLDFRWKINCSDS